MTATTELNGTIVQLESLYNSYNTILDQAKSQLETIDLDDESRKRIVEDIVKDKPLQKILSDDLFRALTKHISDADDALMETYASSSFMKLISKKILETITNRIDEYVKQLVDNVFTSDYIEQQLKRKVDANRDIGAAIQTRDQLRKAMSVLMAD